MGRHLFDKAYGLDLNKIYYLIWGIDGVAEGAAGEVVSKQSDGRLALGPYSDNIRAVGFGAQMGNGVDNINATGLQAAFHLPWAGTITRTVFEADVACSAVMDVKRNGTSIFSNPTYKPTLSSSAIDNESDMTGITTSVAADDALLFNLDSFSGTPKRLTLTIFVART